MKTLTSLAKFAASPLALWPMLALARSGDHLPPLEAATASALGEREQGVCVSGSDRIIKPRDLPKEEAIFYSIPRKHPFSIQKSEVKLEGSKSFREISFEDIMILSPNDGSSGPDQPGLIARKADGSQVMVVMLAPVVNADQATGRRGVVVTPWPMEAGSPSQPMLMGCSFKYLAAVQGQ